MRKLFLLVVLIQAALIGRSQIGGITSTCLVAHFYNGCGTGGFLSFGFSATSGVSSGTPDPLTIQQSNLSLGISVINPQAKLHIKGNGTGTGSTVLVNNSTGGELFRILDNGNIGIGIASPQTTLAVAGVISSKKVKVTQIGWPDYVFHADYRLPELSAVEGYIHQHGHLPGISSAAEVEKEGLDLGDNQAAMLRKIEELTLYVIRQNKEIQELKETNQQLLSMQAQLEQLQKQIAELKK